MVQTTARHAQQATTTPPPAVPRIACGRKGWPHTMTDDVTNLNTFQTNKDQFLGRIIAEAAAQIARGAHLKKEKEDKQKEESKDKSDVTQRQD